jgi:hypothetical protein
LTHHHLAPTVRSERLAARLITETAVVGIGIALVACAFAAGRQWLDRHFLPSFVVSRRVFMLIASLARVLTAGFGLALAFVGSRIGRFVARVPAGRLMADMGSILLAITLALGTSELVLRRTFGHAAEERPADEEPLRKRDPRLGWLFVPARTGHEKIGGREIEYAFDPAGYRVRRPDDPVDPDRPTVVFTGESVMVGYGLSWEESVPAQVEAILGMQCANVAVNGFATDQAYLRLLAELPRFRRPVAVVSLFMPTLFDRNLDEDRPHLGPGLVWLPGVYQSRLGAIGDIMFPYRSRAAIERGISGTREALRATVDLARARGAVPIILVPEFMPEDPTEQVLRRRILDETGLPYVQVRLDASWHVPGDSHPDSRAAHAMAVAIAARLQGRGPVIH